ncbi:unnamed protein product [Gadus morhua 'NCC']
MVSSAQKHRLLKMLQRRSSTLHNAKPPNRARRLNATPTYIGYHIARSPRLEIRDVCLTSDPTAVDDALEAQQIWLGGYNPFR